VKALLIDDERIARQELRRLLVAHPQIDIVGEACTGEEALLQIGRLSPALLFLDIHMPGMGAFEFLQSLEDIPQVIFTTAYDTYALKAFEVGALDYLVKPVAPDRLARALERLRPPAGGAHLSQVFVKDNDQCWLVPLADLYLLESEGNYTRLYFGKERPLIQRSLSALQERLDPAIFLRADRKSILNLRWVQKIQPGIGGTLLITLRSGTTVEVSRRRAALFRRALSL
jgi:two-component system LytT family response regulator